MRLLFLPLFALLLACSSKQKKVEKPEQSVQVDLVDSSSLLRNAIRGNWYFPGNPNLAMEIKGGSVEYMEGFLEVRYSIVNNKFLLLFNPDESVDTVETKVINDTLSQRESGIDSFTKYTRHP